MLSVMEYVVEFEYDVEYVECYGVWIWCEYVVELSMM